MIKLGQQKISRLIIYYTLFFLSGILMGVTVAPIGAWFLAWIALVPLWVLVIKYTSKIDPPAPRPLQTRRCRRCSAPAGPAVSARFWSGSDWPMVCDRSGRPDVVHIQVVCALLTNTTNQKYHQFLNL